LIFVDDLNLPLGALRFRIQGSAGGHNGLKNIEHLLKTRNYPRLRLGIGNNFQAGEQAQYVLGKFSSSEKKAFQPVIKKAQKLCLSFVNGQNILNKQLVSIEE